MHIYCKIHTREHRRVLAACDRELIGKTLSSGELAFTVSESFYKGTLVSEKELKEKLKSSENTNLIGNRVVALAIKEKLVDEQSVIKIQGVKHAQIFSI